MSAVGKNKSLPTKLPDGENATLITHEDLKGIICTLLPDHVSQMINLPSNDPVTQCLEKKKGKEINVKGCGGIVVGSRSKLGGRGGKFLGILPVITAVMNAVNFIYVSF